MLGIETEYVPSATSWSNSDSEDQNVTFAKKNSIEGETRLETAYSREQKYSDIV